MQGAKITQEKTGFLGFLVLCVTDLVLTPGRGDGAMLALWWHSPKKSSLFKLNFIQYALSSPTHGRSPRL